MPDLPRRRRSGGPSWTDGLNARLTPTIKAFVVANALVFFFYVFVRQSRPMIEAHLVLGPGFLAGEVWQALTSLFVNVNPLGFLFNLIGLWFIGAMIEQIQGTRRFVTVFLAAGVLANLAIAVVWRLRPFAPPIYDDGCWNSVLALYVVFGRIHGRTQTRVLGGLFLQARTLAIIFVAWSALANLARLDWGGLAGTLVAAGIGYLGGTRGGLGEAWAALKARRLRRRYRVIDGGAGRPRKKYMN